MDYPRYQRAQSTHNIDYKNILNISVALLALSVIQRIYRLNYMQSMIRSINKFQHLYFHKI